jgi:hypothetical protein
MKSLPKHLAAFVCAAITAISTAQSAADPSTRQTHDRLVARLRAVQATAESFGPAYTPLYRAVLPWYEAWGGRNRDPVDDWAVPPDVYAAELADALEHGHNFIAEHLTSTFPALFERRLPGGQIVMENYLLHLPAGFPDRGRKYPLFISLPGSGWIAHKVSYSRGADNRDAWISVTPILEGRDWQIKFLNEYLDELTKILPVDQDRVYASGHSLGAMATWTWAMSNPERFAAIFPEDGVGQPYRAARLRNVPVWVIHGEKDATFPPGLAEQMVSAVRAAGGMAVYSLLKGAPHNIPPWFNGQPVTDWCLEHSRSHKRPPADQRDALHLDANGFSPWSIQHLPAGMYWKSDPQDASRITGRGGGPAVSSLFAKAEGQNVIVDSPIRYEVDPEKRTATPWLAVPLALQPSSNNDSTIVKLPARDVVRFYFAGAPDQAAVHLKQIQPHLKPGQALAIQYWLTPLGPDHDNSRKQIYECCCPLRLRTEVLSSPTPRPESNPKPHL